MINHIKQLFLTLSESHQPNHALDFNTALAALLIEVMRADGVVTEQELDKVAAILATQCQLNSQAVTQLIAQTRALVEEAIDLFSFVKVINQHTSDKERIDIVELLWHVAFADQVLDVNEEHVIRKIASLLYVSHPDFITAKLAVIPN